MRKYIAWFIFCAICAPRGFADTAFANKLVTAAIERTQHRVRYDGRYYTMQYPGGDVPADVGVCSDVIIRSFRAVGIDLQVLLHEDMKKNFQLYPQKWGLKKPDPNIDHRRVPNLQVFFGRHGKVLPTLSDAHLYKPGDIVTWNLRAGGDLPHIGIVTGKKSAAGTPLVVHNIGNGPQLENILFAYEITGHYRYGSDVS